MRGRSLVGTGQYNDSYGSTTYTLGAYGGERMHRLTIAEMPSHNHSILLRFYDNPSDAPSHSTFMNVNDGYGNLTGTGATDYTGGDQPHNVMQPYIAVHWIMKI